MARVFQLRTCAIWAWRRILAVGDGLRHALASPAVAPRLVRSSWLHGWFSSSLWLPRVLLSLPGVLAVGLLLAVHGEGADAVSDPLASPWKDATGPPVSVLLTWKSTQQAV